MPHVVGVDSSTSACKIQVHDIETGEIVATGRALHPATYPPRSEQDPSAWATAFEDACAQAGVGKKYMPSALSIAAQQHGMVVLGEDGEVLRPAKLWNDTESAADTDVLLYSLDGDPASWADACGSVLVPSFTITKLHWLSRCEPQVFARIAHVLLPHDWLTFRLTGRWTTDRGDASGTGYWSPRESRYRYDLLGLVDAARDWPSMLPTVLSPTEPAGEWPGTGTVVGAGTGDNMAVALGLGLRPKELALSFGTSATAFTVSETPASDVTGTVAGFADGAGRFLPLVCTMNAAKVIDAMARLIGVTLEQFDELALACSAGAGGLVLVPHFDGERTPNRPGATGSLRGLRSDVTPAQIARATVEGVVCNLLAGVDALRSASLDARVFLVGGAARSAAFRRVVADMIGSPVRTVPEELAATGAALQAAATYLDRDLGHIAESWGLGNGDVTEPDLSVAAEEIRARYADAARREAE